MTLIIDDRNYSANPIPGLLPRDYSVQPFGSLPYTSPFEAAVPLIPESEWIDRLKVMAGKFVRQNYTDTVSDKNQNGLPYCWAWSLAQCAEARRASDGQPYVELAPVSLGGSVHFRKEGNYCGAAIKYAVEHGICDSTFPDSQYSLSPSRWKTGWEDEAKNHKVDEFWELGNSGKMWAETVTALLSGFAVYVGLNWWSHAVMYDELVMQGSELCISGPNSWGPGQRYVLKGSRKIPSEAYVVRSVTFSAK
jgi:hypothetical protein